MMETKRSHYNPCFWTAHWNPTYYAQSLAGYSKEINPRKQTVFSLNIKSRKILSTTVERIHFDKTPGTAEITREAAERFCARYRPEYLEEFKERNKTAKYPVAIEPEQLLRTMEILPCYQILLDVVRRQNINTAEDKCFLAFFVYLQFVRSHAIMNATLEWHSNLGIDRFESFVTLKWNLEDKNFLEQVVTPLVFCRWNLFATDRDEFPLCDSPILSGPDSIIVALSPRPLLKIYPRVRATEHQWIVRCSIKPSNLADFRRRTIGNTFREIIFSDRAVLDHWSATPEFAARADAIQNMTSYNRLVSRSAERETWELNVHGNRTAGRLNLGLRATASTRSLTPPHSS